MTARAARLFATPALALLLILLPAPRVLATAAVGSCGACGGSDRAEISFRAAADVTATGSVAISCNNLTKRASATAAGPLATATGLAVAPPETVLTGEITVTNPSDNCGFSGNIAADFVPYGGCGMTFELRTKLSAAADFGAWSANLHPSWTSVAVGTAPLVIQYQLHILRSNGGIASAPPAATDMTPPTVSKPGNAYQTDPAAFSSRIPLGATTGTGSFSAGSLVLAGPLATSLASRGNLALRSPIDTAPFDAGHPDLLHAINDTGNALRQVKSATRLMDLDDVVENGSVAGFRVRVFEAGSYANTLSGGLYPINGGAGPSVTYIYRAVPIADAPLGGLRMETLHRDGTTETRTYLNTTTTEYTITEGDGLETVTVSSNVHEVAGVWQRTDLETVVRDTEVYSKTERDFIFQTVSDSNGTTSVSPFLTAERRYTDANTPLETIFTPSAHPGLPEIVTRPDGGWEKHIYYDGSGTDGGAAAWLRLPKQIISPWNDEPAVPPTSGTANCQVVTLTYTAVDGLLQATGRTASMPPSERTLLSAAYNISTLVGFLGDAGLAAAWLPTNSDVATIKLADVVGSEQIPSTSISYVSRPAFGLTSVPVVTWGGRSFATLDAEGDGTVTGYEPGTFNAATGAFATVSPANLASATHLRAISLDLRNAALPADGEKVKRVTIEDLAGRVVREELCLHDGTAWSVATVSTTTYDDAPAGALRTVTQARDGRTTRQITEVSPFETVTIDEQGITTTTNTDALGRVTYMVVAGCGDQPARSTTTINVGRWAAIAQSAGGLTLVGTETQDLLGRTISRTDPTEAVTATTYPNNGRDTAVTYPGNNTLLTTRTIDGLTISTTGTAAVNEYWSYAIANGQLLTTRRTAASDSGRAVTTATDAAGRQVTVTTPSPESATASVTLTTGYAPNTRRPVSRTSTAANTAPQLSVRTDAASSLQYSGLDADANGTLTVASADRLTATRSYYLYDSDLWWAVTESKVYDIDSSAQSAVTTTVRERLSGNDNGTAGVTIKTLPGSGTVTTTVAFDRDTKTRTVTTIRSDCNLPETAVNANGLDVSQTTNQSATPTVRHFDGLGRIVIEISPLGAVTRTAWNADGQVESVTDQFNHATRYTWWEANTAAAGRLKTITNALGKTTSHTWSTRGELLTTTGTAAYPVTYTFDDHGDLQTQTTWRAAGNGDTTTWQRAPNSGVLVKRINADATDTDYTWYANGKPHTRERESGAITTWTWNNLGDLTAIGYTGDDNRTPDVAITAHTRLGQPSTITQNGIGTETIAYHPGRGTQASHTYAAGHTLLPGKQIAWEEPDAYGQPTGFTPSDGPAVAYAWDQGLLHTVTAGTQSFTYAYRPNTAMVTSVTANNGTANTFVQSYSRDIAGRLLAASSAVPGTAPTPLTRHGYQLDDLNRRTRTTLLDGSTWGWGYNDRSEVTAATRKQPTGTEVAALGASYSYDGIGNRITSTSPILGDFGYTANSANQYSAITSNDSRTVIGNGPLTPTITVNGDDATRIDTLFYKDISTGNLDVPAWLEAEVSDGTTTQTRHVWLPTASTNVEHDDDGNLKDDGQWTYTWDAENRLVKMETTPAAVGVGRPFRKLIFAYDWTGRRLARTVTDNTNTVLSATRWLYDGWNPVAEYSVNETTGALTLDKSYLWGVDISGTLTEAGGVGGLLAVINPNPTIMFHPSFDGNGNVTAWTQSGAATPVCLREYDAFGNVVVEQGTAPYPFGFSTKLEDPETGLLHYGRRYYSPPLGRWLSQDPIEEEGGVNLYEFVGNDGVNSVDAFGQQVWAKLTVPLQKAKFKGENVWEYQIDMYFNYKICGCSEENPNLQRLDEAAILAGKKSVEDLLAMFAKTSERYAIGRNNVFRGTLKIWPTYIGNSEGRCSKRDIEEKESATHPFFNVIFVDPYIGPGRGAAQARGTYWQIMDIAYGNRQHTFGHELGHMIGYEHPHDDGMAKHTPSPYKEDIMVQTGDDPKIGSGNSSHYYYMHQVYKFLEDGKEHALGGLDLINSTAIMKTDTPMPGH
jgi:RHS repeat-associated protein